MINLQMAVTQRLVITSQLVKLTRMELLNVCVPKAAPR